MPLISETNTLTNTYDFKYFTELYEENITTAGILIKTANSLTNMILNYLKDYLYLLGD